MVKEKEKGIKKTKGHYRNFTTPYHSPGWEMGVGPIEETSSRI